jgi:uncharacterized protein (PEP-CTERM system associated)
MGFARELGDRLSAEFAFGERSFGSSRSGALDYDFGRGGTAFGYTETPTTSANDRFSRGDLLEPSAPNDYLYRPGSVERYISKLLVWSFNLDLQRTTFAISLFDESREERSQADGTPLADDRQAGATLSASWQLGSRTQLYLRGARIEREFASGEESALSSGAIGASYQLGRRTQLALEFEAREQASDQLSSLNYHAELLSLVLSRTF